MHLFGERGFKERISSPISSLFKLTLRGAASKILTLSPKRCMTRNYTGANNIQCCYDVSRFSRTLSLSIIVLMMALCLSLQTHQYDTYTIHQGYKKHNPSPGKTTFSGIAARFTTPSLRFIILFLWNSSPPPRSPPVSFFRTRQLLMRSQLVLWM
jgi:hypothetical protein